MPIAQNSKSSLVLPKTNLKTEPDLFTASAGNVAMQPPAKMQKIPLIAGTQRQKKGVHEMIMHYLVRERSRTSKDFNNSGRYGKDQSADEQASKMDAIEQRL